MQSSENSSKAASHQVISSTGSFFILQVIGQLLALVANRIILSILSIPDNGLYSEIQRLGTFAMFTFVDAGMSNFAVRSAIREPDHADEIMSVMIKFRFLLWAIVTGGLLVFIRFMSPTHIVTMLLWSTYLLISAKGYVLRIILEIRYRAHSKLVFINLLALLDIVLFLCMILIDLRHLTIYRITLWYLLSSIPGFVVLFAVLRGWRLLMLPFSYGRLRQLVQDTFPYFISILILLIHDYADIFFLEIYSGKTEVGIYSAAYRIVTPMSLIANALLTGILPTIIRFQEEDIERCKYYVFHALKLLMIIGLCISLLTSVITPQIIGLLAGGKYLGSVNQFNIFFWIQSPNFAINYIMYVFVGLGFQKKNLYISTTLSACTVLLHPFLTPYLASTGAIIVKLSANIIAVGVSFRILQQFLQNNMLRSMIWRFLAVSLILLGLSLILPVYLPRLLVFVLVIPIFAFLMYGTKLIGSVEIELLKSFLSSLIEKIHNIKKRTIAS